MTQQIINVGVSPNDSTGDPIRLAFQKINNNFTELYSNVGSSTFRFVTNTISTTIGDINLSSAPGANVVINNTSQLVVSNPATSTSPTTGALIVIGGLGVGGSLHVSDSINAPTASFSNLDNTPIGSNTPASGKFTTLDVSGVTNLTSTNVSTLYGTHIGNTGTLYLNN